MIGRPFLATFKEPNFKCTIQDFDGKRVEWISWAESEQAIRQRFRRLTVIRIEPYNFAEWKNRADIAKNATITLYHERTRNNEELSSDDFDSEIWRDLKKHLFELFDGKCAYCESKMHTTTGDVDHYRPKTGVKEDEEHPGYYWLSYNVQNLLPVCPSCNREQGKMGQFPIKGVRAYTPEDVLTIEQPLLLNPYFDNPEEHLEFKTGKIKGSGFIIGKTDIGRQSCKTYHLSRDPLQKERQKAQDNVISALQGIFTDINSNSPLTIEKGRRKLEHLKAIIFSGEIEFSAAVKAQAQRWMHLHYYFVREMAEYFDR